MRLRVQFIHGLESHPQGTKARYLARSFDALTPAMNTGDFAASVAVQAEALARFQPDVIVGSSYGGAIAVALIARGLWRGPTVLLAPAARMLGIMAPLGPEVTVTIAHGLEDEIIPIEDSRALAATGDPAKVRLVEVRDAHRLNSLVGSKNAPGDLASMIVDVHARAQACLASAARRRFAELHQQGCFVLPNPWDAGTARFLASAGFQAVATTSAGLAFSMGLPDATFVLSREVVLDHARAIVRAAAGLPVNVDFQSGYGATPDEVAESVRLCVATGVAGLSIEDATGERALFPLDEAVARVAAARAASPGVLLTARAECFLVGQPDLGEVIRRLRAYADAGADCLYAPGLTTREQISAVVAAVAPKPVNVLASSSAALAVADLAALGVRRVSLGSALARVAWGAFMGAARQIQREGRFDRLGEAASFAELDALFGGSSGLTPPRSR